MSTRINKLLAVGAVFVMLVTGCRSPNHYESNWAHEIASGTTHDATESRSTYVLPAANQWACPMHAQVKQSEPGKCPICGMDLVRSEDLYSGQESSPGPGHAHSSGTGNPHTSGSRGGCCG